MIAKLLTGVSRYAAIAKLLIRGVRLQVRLWFRFKKFRKNNGGVSSGFNLDAGVDTGEIQGSGDNIEGI